MINATGTPQRILLLGGSSEIGLAIVTEYLKEGPAQVVLACRPGDPERDRMRAIRTKMTIPPVMEEMKRKARAAAKPATPPPAISTSVLRSTCGAGQ